MVCTLAISLTLYSLTSNLYSLPPNLQQRSGLTSPYLRQRYYKKRTPATPLRFFRNRGTHSVDCGHSTDCDVLSCLFLLFFLAERYIVLHSLHHYLVSVGLFMVHCHYKWKYVYKTNENYCVFIHNRHKCDTIHSIFFLAGQYHCPLS